MENQNSNCLSAPRGEEAEKGGGAIEFQKAGHTWKFWNPKPEYPGSFEVRWEFAVDGQRQPWKAYLAGDIFRFSSEIKIDGQKVGGVRIPDRKLEELAWEMKRASMRAAREARDSALAEFRAGKTPTKIYIGIGGDTHRMYVCPAEGDWTLLDGTDDWKAWEAKVVQVLERIWHDCGDKSVWLAKIGCQKTDMTTGLFNVLYDDGTWGLVDLRNPTIQAEFAKMDAEARAKAEAAAKAKAEREQENARAIAEARRTGKAVYIRVVGHYEGNDDEEEGLVEVWEVATPDGKVVCKDIPTH